MASHKKPPPGRPSRPLHSRELNVRYEGLRSNRQEEILVSSVVELQAGHGEIRGGNMVQLTPSKAPVMLAMVMLINASSKSGPLKARLRDGRRWVGPSTTLTGWVAHEYLPGWARGTFTVCWPFIGSVNDAPRELIVS